MMIDYFILGYLVSSIIDSIIELVIYLNDRRAYEKEDIEKTVKINIRK